MKRTILLALLLAGCGGPTSGEVINKEHHLPRNEEHTRMQCMIYGTNGGCKTWMPVTYDHHHPEEWILHLRDCSGDKCREGTVHVDSTTYEMHRIGDVFEGVES